MSNTITRETPLAEMTAGELADFLASTSGAKAAAVPEAQQAEEHRRYVYGLKGIMELFNCSNVTAQRYKNGVIADAVKQYGRKIVIDAEKALELFDEAKAL